MNKYWFSFFLLLGFFSLPFRSSASHIFGADFYYEHIAVDTYSVTLVIYGDCSGASFPALPGSPLVEIRDQNTLKQSLNLPSSGPGIEVTPVCPSQINNTTCKGGTVPGVTQFTYSARVVIPYPSANWNFRFTGNMGASSSAGRSNSITNLAIGANGSLMVMVAELNNMNGGNSSPRFTTIPTPFYCVNVLQQYNQGAVDPDGDSLDYALTSALETGANPATYINGYGPTFPLATSGPFTFNPLNGQMSFTPSQIQKSTVVNKVLEHRNGIVVGTAMREMTFIVLGSCNNIPPSGNADTAAITLQGAVPDGLNFFNVCQGTTNAHFVIHPIDPDGDTIQVTVNGLPAGATIQVLGNNTTAPLIHFHWNTTGVTPGLYSFYVTYKDQGCPLSSQQTQAYTIRVVRPNELTTQILSPTQCLHRAAVQFNLAYGLLPRSVVISQGATIIHAFTDSSGTATDSLYAGVYTVTLTSPRLACPSVYTVLVPDSGRYPLQPISGPVFYCLNDPPIPLAATPTPGASLSWYDAQGNPIPLPPVPNTTTPGIFSWLVSQRFNVCESRKDTIRVYVTQRPVAAITAPPLICTRDTAHVSFSGAIGVGPIINYQWGWSGADYLLGQLSGPWDVQWNSPGIKKITLQVFENQCPSVPVSIDVLVKPTPLADFSQLKNSCIYDTLLLQYLPTPLQDQGYRWTFDDAAPFQSSGSGPFRLHWNSPGQKQVFLEVSLDGCSDTASRFLTVYPAPEAQILNTPSTLCLGDKIFLQASGGISYSWSPKDLLYHEPDGTLFTRVRTPTTYTVTVRNEFNCVDSDSITYDRIEPCCHFSYPNAFTPNGDGLNDRFRVMMYGNEAHFTLGIYNRWGQRVFISYDPKAYWDGSFNGKPCEPGVYFYYLKAQCLTGQEEWHQGDLMLIR